MANNTEIDRKILDLELSELLEGFDSNVKEKYKEMEMSVRDVYNTLSQMDLPVVDPKTIHYTLHENIPPISPAYNVTMTSENKSFVLEPRQHQKKFTWKLPSKQFKKDVTRTTKGKNLTQLDKESMKRIIPEARDSEVNMVFNNDIKSEIETSPALARKWGRSSTNEKTNRLDPVKTNLQSESYKKRPVSAFVQIKPKQTKAAKPLAAKKRRPKTAPPKTTNPSKLQSDKDTPTINIRLPLEWFDDPLQFESKPPSHWLKANPEGVMALSRYNSYVLTLLRYHSICGGIDWKWEKCIVQEYNEETELFLIQWIDRKCQKWVRRFNLLFPGDNLDSFSRRMEFASNARNEFESQANTDSIIKKIDLPNMAPMPIELKQGALKRIGMPLSKKQLKIIDGCFDELAEEYEFAMKKVNYEIHSVKANKAQSSIDSERLATVLLTESGADADDSGRFLFCKVANAAKGLSDHMFNANANIQKVILMILGCLKDILKQGDNFFTLNARYPMDFITFRDKVNANGNSIQSILRLAWPQQIAILIESHLSSFFNLKETNLTLYTKSRCKSFLGLVNAIMEGLYFLFLIVLGQVHNVIFNGLRGFERLFKIENTTNEQSEKSFDKSYEDTSQSTPAAFLKIYISIKSGNEKIHNGTTLTQIEILESNEIAMEPSLQEIQQSLENLYLLPVTIADSCIPTPERLVLPYLESVTSSWLKTNISSIDSHYQLGKEELSNILSKTFPGITALFQKYQKFQFLVQSNAAENLKVDSLLDEFELPLRLVNDALQEFESVSWDVIEFPPFLVDCSLIKQIYTLVADETFNSIANLLSDRIKVKCQNLLKTYRELTKKILLDPGLVAHWWKDLQTAIEKCSLEYYKFNNEFSDIKNTWELMYTYGMRVGDDINELYWSTFKWPNQMQEDLLDAKNRLELSRINITERISTEQSYVTESLSTLEQELRSFELMGDLKYCTVANQKVEELEELVSTTSALATSINKQQAAMGIPLSECLLLEKMTMAFEKYKLLWTVADDTLTCLNLWVNEWFMNLNAELIVSKVHTWNTLIQESETNFLLEPSSLNVVKQLKTHVDEFWRNTHVITALRNPALKPVHWEHVHKIIGLSLIDFQSLRLVEILDLDLELVQSVIADISKEALLGYNHDQMLEKFKSELSTAEFHVTLGQNMAHLVITNGQDAAHVLEDQLIECERVFLSLTNGEAREKYTKWIQQCQRALEMIASIVTLQEQFLKLNPILGVAEAQMVFSRDTLDSFNAIKKTILNVLDVFTKNRKFINLIYRSDLHSLVTGGVAKVRNLMADLESILEAKREMFPRFYFATNEQVIATLSITATAQLENTIAIYFPGVFKVIELSKLKESLPVSQLSVTEKPRAARGALQKSTAFNKPLPTLQPLLSNNAQLKKELDDMMMQFITGVESQFQEALTFATPIETHVEVEKTLIQLESKITECLKDTFFNAFESINSDNPILEFLEKYPMQIVQIFANTIWYGQLLSCARNSDKNGFESKKAKLSQFMDSIIDMLRYKISAYDRLKKEIIVGLLCNVFHLTETIHTTLERVTKMITYEYSSETRMLKVHTPQNGCFRYGFEYLPVFHRSEISEEMSKMLSTLTNSVMQNRNPLLIHSESFITGTETFTDLSYYLGYSCYIYSCRMLELGELSAVIKGSKLNASCVVLDGIDELNDSSLMHLSKFLTVKIVGDTNDLRIPVISTISSIREWGKLSKELRGRYRTIGLFTPNLEKIIEVQLILKGFKQFKVLAKRIIMFVNGSKLIFSPSITITFRIVKDIIFEASKVKNEHLGMNEVSVFKRVMMSYFRQCLSGADLTAIKTVISATFRLIGELDRSQTIVPKPIDATIQNIFLKSNLVGSEYFMKKSQAVLDLIQSKYRVLIVGDFYVGKSTLWKVAKSICAGRDKNRPPVQITHISSTLLSTMALSSSKAINGSEIYMNIFKKAIEYSKAYKDELQHSWLVFDGSLSNSSFDLSSQFLDSKKFTINPLSKIGVIYESNTLIDVNPTVLTRCRVVYLDGKQLKIDMLLQHLLKEAPESIRVHSTYINSLHNILISPIIAKLQALKDWPSTIFAEKLAHQRAFTMFVCLMKEKGQKGYEKFTIDEQYLWILYTYIFITIWTVGNHVRYEKRVKFDSILRQFLLKNGEELKQLEKLNKLPNQYLLSATEMPKSHLVFDFVVDDKIIQWTTWNYPIENSNPSFSSVFPSKDISQVKFFCKVMSHSSMPIFITGCSGVGKTVTATSAWNQIITNNSKNFEVAISKLFVTSDTSNKDFQVQLERIVSKKRVNARGSHEGKRKVLFIDDLDQVFYQAKHFTGPLEFVRSICDSGGWFSSTGMEERIGNIQFTGTYKSELNREDLMERWGSYVATVVLDDNETDKLFCIFQKLLSNKLGSGQFKTMASQLINATAKVLSCVKSIFKPTPINPHYVFSMKECVSTLLAISFNVNEYRSKGDIMHYWYFSCNRIFFDRLSGSHNLSLDILENILKVDFETTLDDFSVKNDPFIYLQSKFTQSKKGTLREESIAQLQTSIRYRTSWLSSIDSNVPYLYQDAAKVAANSAVTFNDRKSHFVLIGKEYSNRRQIIQLATLMADWQFMYYNVAKTWISEKDEATRWVQFLRNIYTSSTNQSIALFIYGSELSSSQWLDVISMIKYGVPIGVMDRILQRDVIRTEISIRENEISKQWLSKLRLCISLPEGEDGLYYIKKYPCLVSHCEIQSINPLSENSIQDILEAELSNIKVPLDLDKVTFARFTHSFLDNFPKLLTKAFPYENSVKCIGSDAIFTFVKVFAQIFAEKMIKANENLEKCDKALSSIENAFEVYRSTKSEYESFMLVSQDVSTLTNRLLAEIEAGRGEIDNLQSELKKELDQLNRAKEEEVYLKHLCVSELEKLLPSVQDANRGIESLQRGDIYDIKGLNEPSKNVLSVMEAVVFLIRYDLKPGESIWNGIKRMISEKNFQTKLTDSIKEIHLVTPLMLHTVDRIVKSDSFNTEPSLKGVAVLKEWVVVMHKYHNMNMSLHPKRRLLQETELKVISQNTVIEEIEQTIKMKEQHVVTKRTEFSQTMKAHESSILQLKELEFKISSATGFISSLEILKYTFNEKRVDFHREINQIESLCIFAAIMISIGGPFSVNVRQYLKAVTVNFFKMFNLTVVDSELTSGKILETKQIRDHIISLDLPLDEYMHETMLIALYQRKIPLIEDPFFQSRKWFPAIEKNCSIHYADLTDENLEDTIETCVKEGHTLVLSIPKVVDFGKLYFVCQSVRVSSGEKKSLLTKAFKLYLVSKCEVGELLNMKSFNSRVSVIKVSFIVNAAMKQVEYCICQLHNQELWKKKLLALTEQTQLELKFEMLIERALEFSGSIGEADVFGGDLYRTIIDIETQLTRRQTKPTASINQAILSDLIPYEKIGKALGPLYGVIQSFYYVNPLYIFNVEDFLQICKDKASNLSLQVSDGDIKNYCEEVIKAVYYSFAPGLLEGDRSLFSFLYSSEIAKIPLYQKDSQYVLNSTYIRFLFFAIADTETKGRKAIDMPPIRNPCKHWLNEIRWGHVLELSKLANYQQLAIEFGKNGSRATTPSMENSWQEVFDAKDPLVVPFPNKWQLSLTRVERLLIFRPDILCHIIDDYSKTILGIGVFDAGWPADLFHQSFEDVSSKIFKLSSRVGNGVPKRIVGNELDEMLNTTIPQAVTEGSWLIIDLIDCDVLNFESMTKKIQNCISSQFVISGDFRLWFLATKDHMLSNEHMSKTLSVCYEEDREYRSLLYDAFLIAESHPSFSLDCDLKLRHAIFNYCLFFSILQFRMRSEPFCTLDYLSLTHNDLYSSISMLYSALLSEKFTLDSEEMFINVFMNLGGSQIRYPKDFQFCLDLYQTFLRIQYPEVDDKLEFNGSWKTIYNLFQAFHPTSMQLAFEFTASLRSGMHFDYTLMSYSDNIFSYLESIKSRKVVKAFTMIAPELAQKPLEPANKYSYVNDILKGFLGKIEAECTYSWFKFQEPRVNKNANRLENNHNTKHLEIFMRKELERYHSMVVAICKSIRYISCQLEGSELFNEEAAKLIDDILKDKIPSTWKSTINFYHTKLGFTLWMKDFLSRIFYTRTIMLDAAMALSESPDNLEIETVLISERQKNPPERGCYISGLTLYGAIFDTHKNCLKDGKASEVSSKMPCVWLLPKVRLQSANAKKAVVRSSHKKMSYRIECPIYITKQFISPFKSRTEQFYEDNYVGSLHLVSEHPSSYWTLRSMFLACEKSPN
ncbi:Dynein heavy chain 3, axonemal [Globomyces sp. JEL0801]|nr:Dynein heavy chain 3, axonemal [Globomyces sp. JEL0801]